MSVTGIDVSHHQGKIDWPAVYKAGRRFAWLKLTESTGYLDPTSSANAKAAKAAGLLVGGYHFGHPEASASAQAARFVKYLKAYGLDAPGNLPPVLDLEITGGRSTSAIRTWAADFCAAVAKATGRTPMIYSGQSFANDHLNTKTLAQYPLWVARYSTSKPVVPAAWKGWTVWQHTSSASVPGISGRVDSNVYPGTLTQLRALAGTKPPAPKPKPQEPALSDNVKITASIAKSAFPGADEISRDGLLQYAAAYAKVAARDAAVARSLAEASANAGRALSNDEIKSIADAVEARLGNGIDVHVTIPGA